MKRTLTTITILALATVMISNAQAGDKRVAGMIIGGGTGAIVGQVVGRNAESTIIGATVGGVAGFLIGNELQQQHRPAYHPDHFTVYQQKHGYRGDDRRYRPVIGHGYQPYRPYRENCRKIVTIKNGHHQTKRVVTTICDNNYRQRHGNKHNDRF